jgi:hypothetical protein
MSAQEGLREDVPSAIAGVAADTDSCEGAAEATSASASTPAQPVGSTSTNEGDAAAVQGGTETADVTAAKENSREASDPTLDQGDHDPSSRARDLISRDLLDELSHEPDDWNVEACRNPPTPPIGGFETPSEPGTPREAPQPQYYQTTAPSQNHHNHQHDGLMSIDQWDWKTDAPEFVPGSMKGLLGHTDVQVVGAAYQQQGAWTMQSQQQGVYQQQTAAPAISSSGGDKSGGSEEARLSQLKANYDWQLRSKTDELRDMQQRMNHLEIENAQVRASWEIERRGLVRQIGHYRAVLERYCIPVEEQGTGYGMEDTQHAYFPVFEPSAPSQWSRNSAGQSISANVKASTSNAGAFGAAAGGQAKYGTSTTSQQAAYASASDGAYNSHQALGTTSAATASNASAMVESSRATASSALDTKMGQLKSLLQEESRWRLSEEEVDGREQGADDTYNGSSIASTLRAMFPHATIRTKQAAAGEDGEDGDKAEADDALDQDQGLRGPSASPTSELEDRQVMDAVLRTVEELEDATGNKVDNQAMRSLRALSKQDMLEALTKVEEMMLHQGGECRNLSAILQSVCRKIVKRQPRGRNAEEGIRQSNGRDEAGHHRDGGNSRRARRLDEDGDAFDSSGSDGDRGGKGAQNTWPREFERAALRAAAKAARAEDAAARSQVAAKEAQKALPNPDIDGTPAKRSSARSTGSKSWADLEDGDEDEREGDGLWKEDKDPWTPQLVDTVARKGFDLRRRGDQWDLKISMGSLEPPLTETGMERYCRWLRVRLTSFREEHGPDSLLRCRGEVDFSHNQLSNQMVWMLLETLAQNEVHTALLKLYANRISQGGVLAICEFIRMNERAEALQELHLSHNEVDDESALELLRTFKSLRPRYPPRRAAEGSGEIVLVPVWLRLNHNRIRDPAAVLRAAEDENINVCTAGDRQEWRTKWLEEKQACGTSKSVRGEVPLAHLYAFASQDLSKRDKHDENGDGGRRPYRRRER